jgi:hypothetical protein
MGQLTMWDEEVDVVCVGGAIGALPSAVIAVDAGAEVFVATTSLAPGEPSDALPPSQLDRGWLSDPPADEETVEYFAALSDDLTALKPGAADADLPITEVREQTRSERDGRTVEPFVGGRLRTWASECLRSPYGLVHTRVADWQTTTMHTLDDVAIEVTSVGTLDLSDDRPSLSDWLADLARNRRIDVRSAARLQRLVFEEGEVVGAVIDTPAGPYAIRARHGVTIAPGDQHAAIAGGRTLRKHDGLAQVCLVSRLASRFARLELLHTASGVPQHTVTCHSVNRQLHHAIHEVRPARSDVRRGRKVHWNPPFSQ